MASGRRRNRIETAAWVVGLPARPTASDPFFVDSVTSIDEGWRLALAGRALEEPIAVTLTRWAPDEAYFARAGELGLRYEGQQLPPIVRRLLLTIARRLTRISLAALEELLGEERVDDLDERVGGAATERRSEEPSAPPLDGTPRADRLDREGAETTPPAPHTWPGAARPSGPRGEASHAGEHADTRGPARPAAPRREARFPGIHQAWSHPMAWAHFVAEEELMPARDVAFQLAGESVRVEHGDFECQFVDARGFVVRPWAGPPADRGRRRRRRSRARPAATAARPAPSRALGNRRLDPRAQSLFTNLRDLDAIDGGTERFEQLLVAVREHVRPDVLMVNCTCVPQIIGDDAEFVVAEQRRCCSFPIVYKDQSPQQSPHERGLAMMRDALAAEAAGAREPNRVNLVGFTKGRDREELCALLGELGISVGAMLVPEISPALVGGFGRAALQVLFPNPDWLPFCEKLLGRLETPRVTAPAPYGFEGTRAFVSTVASALDRRDLEPAIASRAERFHAERWTPLVEQARGERVGFVCELEAAERMGGIELLWGCPVLPLLGEMGFGLSIALVCRNPDAPAVGRFQTKWTQRGAELTVVEEEAALGRWLDRAEIRAIYSDFFFDTRLLRAGHTPFSSRIFERGWAGAIRSGERLLDRCRLGLVRHHARHLF